MMLPSAVENLIARLQKAWNERAFVLKAASFAMVGVVNTLVDASVFFVAYALLPRVVLMIPSLIVANVMSWMAGMTCSYVLNSSITFAHETGRRLSPRAYATFAASGIIGLVANTTTLVITREVILMPIWAAKACAILVSFLVNFSMSHFVVFRRRTPTPET